MDLLGSALLSGQTEPGKEAGDHRGHRQAPASPSSEEKMAIKTVKVKVEMEVPFHSYGTKAKDAKAVAHIRRWIRDTLTNGAGYIPLYVERDEHGGAIEDCTNKTKVRLK